MAAEQRCRHPKRFRSVSRGGGSAVVYERCGVCGQERAGVGQVLVAVRRADWGRWKATGAKVSAPARGDEGCGCGRHGCA